MPIDVSTTFRTALALHQRGDVAAAQVLYAQVLDADPKHFDSLHLLGLTHVQRGSLERGATLIAAAIALRPDFAEARYNLANALLSLGRAEEALGQLDKAIALNGGDPLYHFERGNALNELGRQAEALRSFEAATRLAPRYAEAYNNMGIVLKEQGSFADAVRQYDKAISLKPDYAEAHSNRGNALNEMGRHEDALASHDRALRLRPEYAEAHSNRGNALAKLGRHEEALASHDRAISLKPGYAEAHSNRGNALKGLKRLGEAMASYDRAIALKPGYAEAHSNRAGALEDLGRQDEALAEHDLAIRLKPDHAEAHCGRANLMMDLERLDEALAGYETAISLKPSLALARYNKSLLDLRRHDFAAGFELYLSRWEAAKQGDKGPHIALPRWDGRPCKGEVLLWAEQGLGDEVYFASMLSLLDPRQAFVLSTDKRLQAIFARSFPGIRLVSREVTEARVDGPFAAQAAIGDLGHLLRLDREKIEARRYPYLVTSVERQQHLRDANPFPKDTVLCGLAWKSGNKEVGQHRSIGLADLGLLLQLPGITFVNLQYGDVGAEIAAANDRFGADIRMARELDVFHDIDGLLAMIGLCDVVFTIDNVTAHLAGAIGKASAVLVPAGNGRHWYWSGEARSLWYPSLELFYQHAPGDWTGAIEDAAQVVARKIRTLPESPVSGR